MRQVNGTIACGQILLMQLLHPSHLVSKGIYNAGGQDSESVLAALTIADAQPMVLEINILQAKPHQFHDSHPTTVKQHSHQMKGASESFQNALDFGGA
jgi:hypothetical protein